MKDSDIDSAVENLFGPYTPKKAAVKGVHVPAVPEVEEPELFMEVETPAPSDVEAAESVAKQPATPAAPVAEPDLTVPADIEEPVATKKPEISASEDKREQAAQSPGNELVQIKQLTGSMLKHLNQAIKTNKWGEKLYYSHKFLEIAMSVSKLVIKRK